MNLAASCVPGVVWPGVPTSAGAELLSLQWQLARSERWPSARLLEAQFSQIRRLAAHAVTKTAFYRAHLERCGLRSADELVPENFQRWPLLSTRDLQDTGEALIAACPPGHGAVEEKFTTGSTGQPKRILATQLMARFQAALVLRDHLWHRRDLSAKFGAIRFFQEKATQPGWSPTTHAAFATGPSALLGVDTPVDSQLEWLIREEPAYLLTSPSNLRALVRHSAEAGRKPGRLRQVMTYAEALDAEVRKLVSDAWGVPLADTYSNTEAGPIALQCPESACYHVQAESVYVEVLRDDASPCAPGELGRVVLTTLHSFAMPLIRYDTGDYAIAGSTCPCGRGLPVLERIVGRARNMARDREGRLFQPGFDQALDVSRLPVRQSRFVQEAADRIEMSYVAERELEAHEMEAFRRAVADLLPYPFLIRFQRVAEIPRMPGGKFEGFVSLLS